MFAASSWASVLLLLAVALAVPSSDRAAEPSSDEERGRIDARLATAARQLKAGDLEGYRKLLESPDPRLSPARRAALDHSNPASNVYDMDGGNFIAPRRRCVYAHRVRCVLAP